MHIVVIDGGSTKVINIVEMLHDNQVRTTVVPLQKANAVDVNHYDAMVISGGPHLFTDKTEADRLLADFAFVKRLKIPVLGICLGHQGIGLQYGASVFLGEERRNRESIRIMERHPLLKGIDDNDSVGTDHCEGISLPSGFRQLGCSLHYDVEIMASPDDRLFGVQFHPEISGHYGQKLFRNFIELAKS
ncbi:GMP synthase (Fe) [invertebrate metagenome]|uniref:GMP synthase (Fe) n=1 Tax=invertebrate metagenome TaxID=1711999 RepID=A0A2H9T887_9ZZZZ